jgi:hypothetical protein
MIASKNELVGRMNRHAVFIATSFQTHKVTIWAALALVE